jgi:hypothetical protein
LAGDSQKDGKDEEQASNRRDPKHAARRKGFWFNGHNTARILERGEYRSG